MRMKLKEDNCDRRLDKFNHVRSNLTALMQPHLKMQMKLTAKEECRWDESNNSILKLSLVMPWCESCDSYMLFKEHISWYALSAAVNIYHTWISLRSLPGFHRYNIILLMIDSNVMLKLSSNWVHVDQLIYKVNGNILAGTLHLYGIMIHSR